MGESPEHQDGIKPRIFLLTRLKDGRVKADRIRTESDPRLRSKAPFALIKVDINRLTDHEMTPEEAALSIRIVAAFKDEGYLLRPRIVRSMGRFGSFFDALRHTTEDTMLESDRMGRSGAEWRVSANQVGTN